MFSALFSEKNEFKLDYCKIKTKPALDKRGEYFSSSASLVGGLGMEFEHVADGLILKGIFAFLREFSLTKRFFSGVETAKNYEKALEQIHYFNTQPENFAKRIFYIECASGSISSQEFIVTVRRR